MNTFLAVFNAFPSILGAVQAVEAAVPISQSGQQKMNLILGAAATAWEISQAEQQLSKNQLLNAVSAMANLAVASLNAMGVFHTSNPVSPAPVSSN
jgi:hypothetical protein